MPLLFMPLTLGLSKVGSALWDLSQFPDLWSQDIYRFGEITARCKGYLEYKGPQMLLTPLLIAR